MCAVGSPNDSDLIRKKETDPIQNGNSSFSKLVPILDDCRFFLFLKKKTKRWNHVIITTDKIG